MRSTTLTAAPHRLAQRGYAAETDAGTPLETCGPHTRSSPNDLDDPRLALMMHHLAAVLLNIARNATRER